MNELNELLKKYEETYIENNPDCIQVYLEIYSRNNNICGMIFDYSSPTKPSEIGGYHAIIAEFISYDDLIEILKS